MKYCFILKISSTLVNFVEGNNTSANSEDFDFPPLPNEEIFEKLHDETAYVKNSKESSREKPLQHRKPAETNEDTSNSNVIMHIIIK